jgi:UDP-glucose 4-epimerase
VVANLLAMTTPDVGGRIFNIACGRQVSLNDLVDELNRLLGTDIEAERIEPRPGDVKHSLADVSRAERELGFVAAVDFAEGLRRTIEAYESAAAAAPHT